MNNLKLKPKNIVAKDLRTPKYRMRVVQSDKKYKRSIVKTQLQKEMSYVSTRI